MPKFNRVFKKNWVTLGTKLAFGVAIVSNLCIGALVYANWTENQKISRKTDDLLMIKDQLSADLRKAITALQSKYLHISEHFAVDTTKSTLKWLEDNFTIESQEVIEGRENYKKLYKRTGRRDLAKGGFVVTAKGNELFVSHGLMDQNGEFTGRIQRMKIASRDIEKDASNIEEYLKKIETDSDNQAALEKKIQELSSTLADEAIEAEKSRIQIVQFVDKIDQQKTGLDHLKKQSSLMAVFIGLTAVLLNVCAIFLLTNLVVERPLQKLSRIISKIRNGEDPDIPYQRRRDQIGMLSNVLKDFSHMVKALRNEDERKKKEQIRINTVIQKINGMIEQVAGGSVQVSDSSQSLSHGAAEQAASLEQITASLTQFASQTKTNANNAEKADRISKGARNAAEMGNTRMQEVIRAMTRINESGKEISKIIKTIDDIAFQTNLLALNAAVEAARAGKHGKGFSVVAQEVRNLAGKSARAARETAELIDGTVKRVETGTGLVNATAEALEKIVDNANKVSGIISEIAAASNDQSQGIGEINNGIVQIDQVTQQTAANAEETAAASLELSEVSTRLRETVVNLRLESAIGKQPEITHDGATESSASPPPGPGVDPMKKNENKASDNPHQLLISLDEDDSSTE